MVTCKNSVQVFEGEFCNSCGQSAHTHDINFHYIIHEIQHGIVHVDKGFFYTQKELYTRPGDSIREYVEGKRVNHFKPLAFLLILSTIYTFLSHSIEGNPFLESALKGLREGADKQTTSSYIVLDWMIAHYAYTSLLIIPIASLASYLAFIKSKYNYFQHIVLNAFIYGQTTTLYIVSLLTAYLFDKSTNEYTLDIIKLCLGQLLTCWTFFQFFNKLKVTSRIINIIMNYVFFFIFIVVCIIIILLISKI